MKKFLSIVLAVAMILYCTAVFAEEKAISVEIDGKAIVFDVAPVIVDGRTLVPLRAIFEELGAVVNWDDETKTVSAFKENTSVVLQIGTPTLFVGNEAKPMDVPAQIVSDRTLVPLRAVSEAFGCEVEWNADEKKVTIKNTLKEETVADVEVKEETAEEKTEEVVETVIIDEMNIDDELIVEELEEDIEEEPEEDIEEEYYEEEYYEE